jgi:hypothetical protein
MLGEHYSYQPKPPYGFQPKPPTQESTLHRAEAFIERKEFSMLLKENPRGRFVRIVESNGNRPPTSIIVPSTGLREFHKLLCEMMDADRDIPEKGNAA